MDKPKKLDPLRLLELMADPEKMKALPNDDITLSALAGFILVCDAARVRIPEDVLKWAMEWIAESPHMLMTAVDMTRKVIAMQDVMKNATPQ